MNHYERMQLQGLLIKLTSAQSDVIRSVRGVEYQQEETRRLINVRLGVRDEIIAFVEGLLT